MTGTADTEAAEFHSTYKLDVVIIPTNKPIVRADDEDLVYKTEREKFTAVINEHPRVPRARAARCSSAPPASRRASAIARILKKKGIPHTVLNAKHHENEAYVVAQAGRKGAITVSTNMAGRGTDIILGGNPEMIAKLEFKEQNRDPRRRAGRVREARRRSTRAQCKTRGRRGASSSAACTSSAPSATSRAASTTSSAAAPAARATRARAGSTCRSKTT